MTQQEKIENLRALIRERIGSRLTQRCVLLDCPYYANIGDTLIWEGELAFLKEYGCKIVGYGSFVTWNFRPLAKDVHIILGGGGNFGDVWRDHHELRMKIFDFYPDHQITVFPQSVHYQDQALMKADAERLAAYRNLTICARDTRSFDLLKRHFRNEILLVPDMAFYIDGATLQKYARPRKTDKLLYLNRLDKEKNPASDAYLIGGSENPAVADVRDWPTIERETFLMWSIYKLSGAVVRLRKMKLLSGVSSAVTRIADRLAYRCLRKANLKAGVRFMSPYATVASTRLHGVILAMLLGVERIVVLDNNYGKLSEFYDTWLTGTDGIRIERLQNVTNREP